MGQRRPIYQSLCVPEQTPKYCVSLHLLDRAVLTNYLVCGRLFKGDSAQAVILSYLENRPLRRKQCVSCSKKWGREFARAIACMYSVHTLLNIKLT